VNSVASTFLKGRPERFWRLSFSEALHRGFAKPVFVGSDCLQWRNWRVLNPPNRRGIDPYARWCGEVGIASVPLSQLIQRCGRSTIRRAIPIVRSLVLVGGKCNNTERIRRTSPWQCGQCTNPT
jgi:hypothetical protein